MRSLCLSLLVIAVSACSGIYDFDGIENLPCTGAGNCAPGYTCLTDTEGNRCVPDGARNDGESCSRTSQCSSGLICDDKDCRRDEANCPNRLCRQPCDPSDPGSCAADSQLCWLANDLDPAHAGGKGFCEEGDCINDSECTADELCLRLGSVTKGLCTDRCDPLEPNDCEAGNSCRPHGGDPRQTACAPEGRAQGGEACGQESCIIGFICIEDLQAVERCAQVCDPQQLRGNGCEGPNPTCFAIDGTTYGVCIGLCEGWNPDQCGLGFSCQPLEESRWTQGYCGQSGSASRGQPCPGGHVHCQTGLLCSPRSATCQPACQVTQQGDSCLPFGANLNCIQVLAGQSTFGVCE